MRVLYFSGIFGCLAVAGCSQGFSSKAMQSRMEMYGPVFSDYEIARIEQIQPQLRLPFRVAVAPPMDGRGDEWTADERDEFRTLEKHLQETGIITDLVFLPRMLLAGGHRGDPRSVFMSLRSAAARYRADTILLTRSTTDVDSYVNPLSATYLTIVGMWIFPGTHRDALTLMEGVLLDNRNEFLYLSTEVEGFSTVCRPYIYVEEEEVIRASRADAVRALCEELASKAGRILKD